MVRPKIVMVANHSCVRVQKQALVLMRLGYNVHLITGKLPAWAEKYKSISLYIDGEQLDEAIWLHRDAHIFHCHNEPNWYVKACKAVCPEVPVVLDMHDSFLLRVREEDVDLEEGRIRITVDERDNSILADGHVFVSEPMANEVRSTFGLTQPHTVLYSYVPQFFFRIDPFKWLGGVCYEGRLDVPKDREKHGKESFFFTYTDFTDLAKELHESDIPFYLYAPRKKDNGEPIVEHYGDTAIWGGQHLFYDMLRKVASHDWGLVGNANGHPAWEKAMPNKLFEYIAAGVPPVVFGNAYYAGKFVEKTGIGIHVQSVDELKSRWKEKRQCRNNLLKKRFNWTMEKHIHKLETLYSEFL